MNLDEVTSALARTPGVLDALLSRLPDDWVHRNDGPDTWSAYDIVGHLLEGEHANWTHLAQAAEVLARRYRTDVGPYRAYLPALDRVAEAE
jgi:hypothetical protein